MKVTLILLIFAFCVLVSTFAAPQPGFNLLHRKKTKTSGSSHRSLHLDKKTSTHKKPKSKSHHDEEKSSKEEKPEKKKSKLASLAKKIKKYVPESVKNATKEFAKEAAQVGIELAANLTISAIDSMRNNKTIEDFFEVAANSSKVAIGDIKGKAFNVVEKMENKYLARNGGNQEEEKPKKTEDKAKSKDEEAEDPKNESLGKKAKNFMKLAHKLYDTVVAALPNALGDDDRKVLNEVLKVLGTINAATIELDEFVPTVSAQISEAIMTDSKVAVTDWLQWGADQIKAVATATDGDEDKVRETKKILYELVARYQRELSNCGEDLIGEVKKFEEDVAGAIKKNRNALRKLKELVGEFLDANIASILLGPGVLKQLEPLRKTAKDFIILQSKGHATANGRFTGSLCVSVALAQFDAEKETIEVRLKQLGTKPKSKSKVKSKDE